MEIKLVDEIYSVNKTTIIYDNYNDTVKKIIKYPCVKEADIKKGFHSQLLLVLHRP